MKILVTSIIDLQKSQHNRPHQFVKYLSKKHDVTVISINDWWKGDQDDLSSYSNDFRVIFNRIEYIHLTNKRVSPILQEIFSRKKINNLIKEDHYDVHLNYSTLVSGYYAARKISTVYDIADDLGAMIKASPQIPSLLRPIGGVCGDIMLNKNINISKRITVTTNNLKNAYKIPDAKVEVLPNGVDTRLLRDHGIKMKDQLGLEGFIIGYVGVLREWIDFKPVFAALKELDSEIKMVIVGKEGRYKENIQLAKSYGLSDRVRFVGMVPYSDVPKYISAMDVCLMPFKKMAISENAVPLKLFEYMACERPIISTRLSGIEKVARNRIFYASTKEEYIYEINKLFHDNSLRKKMGIEGRAFVEKEYEWSAISKKLENILIGI